MSNKSIQALRERRAALATDTRNILEQNPGATWNAEHQKTYDSNMDEIGRVEGEITRIQRVMDLDADKTIAEFTKNGRKENGNNEDPDDTSEKNLYRNWARRGVDNMSPTQREAVRNTMSTTTGSEGGFTVQTDVAKTIADALKAYGGVREVAEVFQTEQGNDIQFPNTDGTSETGELIGQNTTATGADMVFGTTPLVTYKFSSKVIVVPFELLQDSSIDIEALVNKRLTDRLGRITNTFFTTGTGTSQPKGVVTAASSGKVGTTGQTLTVIYDDLIDLQHSVDPSYRKMGCSFMLNDASVKIIRKIKDGQSRPIFVPGYESGVPGGEPDSLLGSPIVVNQDMAVMAANAKSILFGAFSNYKVRDVMQVTLFRFTDSAYSKLGQVGFMAWMRCGGTYTDVGASLKYYQNSAT